MFDERRIISQTTRTKCVKYTYIVEKNERSAAQNQRQSGNKIAHSRIVNFDTNCIESHMDGCIRHIKIKRQQNIHKLYTY